MKKFLLFILLFVLLLFAGQVQKPYTFQPGRVIRSNEVNANFDVLYNVINGNLDGSNIKDNSIPKTKLIGYPFTGYTDLIDGTIYDTQIASLANIHYTKLFGVVNKFTEQLDIDGLKKFLVIPQIDENLASDTNNYQYDNQLTCKKYVDWKVSLAGGGGSYPGNYPIQSSDIADYTIVDTDIASNTLTSRVIQDGAITTAKIQDNAIIETKIQNGAITTSKIQDNSITTSKIQDNAITGAKIQLGTITSGHIANLTIQTEDLADDIITSSKIQNNAITSSKIAVLSDKIYYETTTLIDNTSPDTAIVHKKYVDDKLASSSDVYVVKDYVKTATVTYYDVNYPEQHRDRNYSTHADFAYGSRMIWDLGALKYIHDFIALCGDIGAPVEMILQGSINGYTWIAIMAQPMSQYNVISVKRKFRYLKLFFNFSSSYRVELQEVIILGTDE